MFLQLRYKLGGNTKNTIGKIKPSHALRQIYPALPRNRADEVQENNAHS